MDEYYYAGWNDVMDWYDNRVWHSSTPPTQMSMGEFYLHNETQNILTIEAVSKWMMITLLPVISLFGVVGNILSILVLRKWSSGTITIYLVTLAITDTAVLVYTMLAMWIPTAVGWYITNSSNMACKIVVFVGYALPYFSSWIIVCMAIEKAIVHYGWNVHNDQVDDNSHSRRVVKLLIYVGVFICVLCSHLLYGFSFNEKGHCSVCNNGYDLFFFRIWSWIDLLIKAVVPSVILVVTNAPIIWRYRRTARHYSELIGNNRGIGQSSSECTKILIAICVVYVITTLPFLVTVITGSCWQYPSCWNLVAQAKLKLAFDITLLLYYCNNSANFIVYCLSSETFRIGLSRLIPCCRPFLRLHNDDPQETRPNPGTEIN